MYKSSVEEKVYKLEIKVDELEQEKVDLEEKLKNALESQIQRMNSYSNSNTNLKISKKQFSKKLQI